MSRGGVRPGAGRPTKEYQMPLFPRRTSGTVKVASERDGFTTEQIEQLQASSYVRKVTNKTVSYTLEFKEIFWQQYNSGISPPQIFSNAGFDIDVIGDMRIYGLLTTLRRTKERGIPFTDGREPREQIKSQKPIDICMTFSANYSLLISERTQQHVLIIIEYIQISFINKHSFAFAVVDICKQSNFKQSVNQATSTCRAYLQLTYHFFNANCWFVKQSLVY